MRLKFTPSLSKSIIHLWAEKINYLHTLFTEVYFKDIVERYDIELPDVLSELTDDLCSSVGSLTNASKISNTLQTVKNIKVSGTTISNYLNYLIESFLFSNAKRYDVKGKKYFEYPSKYYCTDIGLRNARLNFRQQEETHIMENIIYNELLCREYSVNVALFGFSRYSISAVYFWLIDKDEKHFTVEMLKKCRFKKVKLRQQLM